MKIRKYFHKTIKYKKMSYDCYFVDDFSIRMSSLENQEFGIAGCNTFYPTLVPKNEYWISNMISDYEVNMKIKRFQFILKMNDHYSNKDLLKTMANDYEFSIRDHDAVQPIYCRIFRKIDDVQSYIVDGENVRNRYQSNFHEGGHGYVYDFIPKNEIWIEKTIVRPLELNFVLWHEFDEMILMKLYGMDYNKAHDVVRVQEFEQRQQLVYKEEEI